MRRLMLVVAASAVLCWPGVAFAVVDETKDVPVTNQGSAIPEGHITIQTSSGKTIASGRVVNGKAHLHVVDRDKNANRDEKVIIKIHDNKTGKTYTEPEKALGALLDYGIDAATGGAAGAFTSEYAAMPETHEYMVMVGVGVPFIHNNATGNFFGPGTGGGISLTNDNWSESVEFTGGVFAPIAPGWYGGLVVNVLTTPFSTSTQSGVTSNGIPVTSKVGQSGVAVDLLGRVGTTNLQDFRYLGLQEVFVEGGEEWARYNAQIIAPTVGDNFIAGQQIAAPVAGIGLGFCPFGSSAATCNVAEVVVKYDHVFFNSNWFTGITTPSSGAASVKGEDRVTVELNIWTTLGFRLWAPEAPKPL